MRPSLLAALAVLLAFSLSCGDENTTVVNSTTDCGLVRSELVGAWTISLGAGSTQLFNCSNNVYNNKNVIIPPGASVTFSDMEVFASGSNVGYFFHNSTSPELFFGNVETDSCGMLFSILTPASNTDATPLYIQCIGTLDRPSGIVNASCDSTSVLASPLTDPVTVVSDCDLTLLVQATVLIQ